MIVLTKWTSKTRSGTWSIQIGDNIRKAVVEIFLLDDGELHTERFGPGEWQCTRHWITTRDDHSEYEVRESSWLELLVLTGITEEQGKAMLDGVGVVYSDGKKNGNQQSES